MDRPRLETLEVIIMLVEAEEKILFAPLASPHIDILSTLLALNGTKSIFSSTSDFQYFYLSNLVPEGGKVRSPAYCRSEGVERGDNKYNRVLNMTEK